MVTFSKLTETEFINYVNDADKGNYLQTKNMADLKKARNQIVDFVGIKDTDQQVLGAALITKIKIGVGYYFDIDGGMLMDFTDSASFNTFIEGLKNYVKSNGGLYLTVTPNEAFCTYDACGEATSIKNQPLVDLFTSAGFSHQTADSGLGTNQNPQWLYKKALAKLRPEELWSSYNKDAQYSVKKAKSFGISTRALSYEELPLFKEITQHTSERRQFDDKSLEYYQAVFQTFGENAKFMIAEINFQTYIHSLETSKMELMKKLAEVELFLEKNPNSRKKNNQKREFTDEVQSYDKRILEAKQLLEEAGKETVPLACALFLICPQEVVYLFSGTYDKYKKFYAPFLIQDDMLNFAVSHQIPFYNFYGIAGKFDGTDGILNFKQAFNGYVEQTAGTFQAIVNPLKYQLYQVLKKSRELIKK